MALGSNAFVPQTTGAPSTTQVGFGFFPSADDGESSDENLEKKDIGLKGLAQLITAGMGAPFLGDYQGVDKESGKFMFSLEANNLVDENGNSKQTSMPFFESGSFISFCFFIVAPPLHLWFFDSFLYLPTHMHVNLLLCLLFFGRLGRPRGLGEGTKEKGRGFQIPMAELDFFRITRQHKQHHFALRNDLP